MCGRLSISSPADALKKRFKARFSGELQPNYNAAPTQNLPVILNTEPEEISLCRWGLIPAWAKDEKIGNRLINARSETLLEKPSFKKPFRTQRCLVLVDGFYEWKKSTEGKIPYRISLANGELFALAGIWDSWRNPEGGVVTSFSIITTQPNKLMEGIHNRMPVILTEDREESWLQEVDISEVQRLLEPYPQMDLQAYPVSKLVNSPRNNSRELIQPLGESI